MLCRLVRALFTTRSGPVNDVAPTSLGARYVEPEGLPRRLSPLFVYAACIDIRKSRLGDCWFYHCIARMVVLCVSIMSRGFEITIVIKCSKKLTAESS